MSRGHVPAGLFAATLAASAAVAACGGAGDRMTERKTETRSAQSAPDTGSAPTESCGGGVAVVSSTSCELPRRVAKAYRAGEGQPVLNVRDPATMSPYKLSCDRLTRVDAVPAVCSAGDEIVIYVR